jgi:thymidylate kinase
MHARGKFYVFEGPDGVGKSELSRHFATRLAGAGVDCELLTFPGKEDGTLGKHVYEIHHNMQQHGIQSLSPSSLQLLHIAAHIDTIENRILPALKAGRTVILDRFWWSTKVYGIVAGASRKALDAMIGLEMIAWRNIRPTAVFLIHRREPFRPEPIYRWRKWQAAYAELANEQAKHHPVYRIDNNGSAEETMGCLWAAYTGDLSCEQQTEGQLPLEFGSPQQSTRAPYVFSALAPAQPTIVFDTYWRFAAERQAIFFKRLAAALPPWTDDPILMQYKFTNAYRASDRVSQFLIRHVIYAGDQSPEEVFFRIILFKLFNKIETWQLLAEKLGTICHRDYSFKQYDKVLSTAIDSGHRIYSAAYIMPSSSQAVEGMRKHRAHLKLLERMMEDELPLRIADTKSMFAGFQLLRSYPMIGDFLAYQYITDLNYSTLTNFTETEFVVPGPGARDGISKCFSSLGGLNETDIIKVVTDRQQDELERLGLQFQSLWGRPLQYIDCQNLFCEVDKYARMKHPEVAGRSQRTRIKQKFRPNLSPVDYWYPPKWGLNERVRNGSPRG